ncbi:MAG: nucleotidyltransferase domain-containing protein [Anaerohalosphaeraceae bacterium]|nr:nucleotidyltransferase domain-containing protein [Anaerohalosphaeraceae bacterium]
MNYGLEQNDIDSILRVLAEFEQIESAVIFGSRAKGNNKEASDVDIAVKGKEITDKTIIRLRASLEDLPLPYFFDVIDYDKIENRNLIEHIDRVGKAIYKQGGL